MPSLGCASEKKLSAVTERSVYSPPCKRFPCPYPLVMFWMATAQAWQSGLLAPDSGPVGGGGPGLRVHRERGLQQAAQRRGTPGRNDRPAAQVLPQHVVAVAAVAQRRAEQRLVEHEAEPVDVGRGDRRSAEDHLGRG